ncbi:MAG: 50S ribosomal protein L11 methyltransferase, partial [Ktedonobacterales bacterium]
MSTSGGIDAMPAHWLELAVTAAPEAVEAICEVMGRYTQGGVAIEEPYTLLDDGLVAQTITDAPVTVRVYVPDDAGGEESRARIEEGLWHLRQIGFGDISPISVRRLAQEDWANAWKEHYHVTHLGRRVVIKPSWREYSPQPHEVVIELDPGMAFGTGLHPTTRTCVLALEDAVHTGDHVLDVGCGSGILSIAALKLGAAD